MSSVNSKINLILLWSTNCVINNATGARTFAITDTKLHLPVVTVFSQDNEKLLQELKSGFKITINLNKYQS